MTVVRAVARRTSLYLQLTKAGLAALVVATTVVGFVVASDGPLDLPRLLWTVLGTALAAGGSLALNQWLEVEPDGRMERTRARPLPSRALERREGLVLAIALAGSGVMLLAWRVNRLAAALAFAVILTYAVVYTPLKPRTSLCTLVGAVCGAIPPMIGSAGASGRLGAGAWILASILFIWQVPHFLSLAWLYREDYARGGFRVLPVVEPSGRVAFQAIVLYTLALIPVTLGLSIAGAAGPLYTGGSVVLGALLAFAAVEFFRLQSNASARRLFAGSIVYMALLLALVVSDRLRHTTPGSPGTRAEASARLAE
ncbi:MAG: heme o synthase [Acidobacteriota bacterium]